MASILGPSEEKTNGTKLARLLIDGGTQALRNVLESFIHPPSTLQIMLNNNKATLANLKSRRKLYDSQWEKLFPPSGGLPDLNTFDITLLHLLLRTICPDLTKPATGWHELPAENDTSREAAIVRIKCFRNDLCHGPSTNVSNEDFEDMWKIISDSLEVLGINRQEIKRLKTGAIDHGTQQRIDEEVEKWKLELKNCLPDVFGRSKEIKQAIEAVQKGTVSFVSLTGGPGFGKTTVANKVADELDESEYDGSVLCCSLLSQATLEDVATTMFFVCDKSHSQSPENPTLWLRKWSKRQSKKVTLILDNADHVLKSEDGQKFVHMLEEMRNYSKRRLTFIIVSGKTFNTSSCGFKIEHIKLTTLPLDDAVKVLLSRTDPEKQQLSQTEKIVELCDRIPLALRIIGSLLSRFKEARLVEILENKPLKVLQYGTDSVENAIKTSFDLLKQREKMALAIMSVFPGSFDFDAAEEVISKGMDIDADLIPILLSLEDRSLVEELSVERYQLHSLIKDFAENVDRFPAPILAKGKKVACAHYMSRLADNVNDYWSKDTCKQSLDSFNEDRHNFEHFLPAFAKWRGSEAMESCEAFFVNLSQRCMYLEMCVLPRSYTDFLQQLLEAFSDPESHQGNQVQKVELLCLLGHEMRKVGKEEKKREKYKDYMMDAEKLYTENKTKFDESPFSAVIYLNSHARFLVEEKIPDKPKKVYEKALEICKDKLPNHPERVETLLRAGTNFKRRKEYKQAEEKFKQALALSEECLGKHVMTARCFKAIADMKFSLQEKLPDGAVLSNYEKSLEILKHLDMEGHKETIHTLKNLGSYHSSNGNYEEARIALERAELVADRELENDHMWKVRVKTEQALVLDKENKEDQMIEAMQNALEMCYRLGKTIEVLGNKDEIRKVLDRYPEIFPKDKYPR